MKKITVEAHPNIALVKYWGKRNIDLNLPSAPSLSATLAGAKTQTEISFSAKLSQHELVLDGKKAKEKDRIRVANFISKMIQAEAPNFPGNYFAKVVSSNDFPTAAGLASSASGFAALAVAVDSALELELGKTRLSEWARRGSGSAARSIFGGWVAMHASGDSSTAVAHPIARQDHWDLGCVICVTAKGPKSIGSTEAMEATRKTSPYYEAWIEDTIRDVEEAKRAILQRDFEKITQVAERSCLRMHACAMSADPGIIYWKASTLNLISLCRQIREDGINVFFTIDAGPHVKLFYPSQDKEKLLARLKSSNDVLQTILCTIGGPAITIDTDKKVSDLKTMLPIDPIDPINPIDPIEEATFIQLPDWDSDIPQ